MPNRPVLPVLHRVEDTCCDDLLSSIESQVGTGTRPECAEATLGLSPLDPVDLGSNHEPLAASMKLNH